MSKSWRVFNDRQLFERCFLCFVLAVLEQCSAVYICVSAVDTHLELQHRVASGASLFARGVLQLEHNCANRRSVAVQCMLYKIR